MNYLEIELSGRTMMLLGGLATIAFIILIIWMAKLYNKKKKA
jgi:hypothetical protein